MINRKAKNDHINNRFMMRRIAIFISIFLVMMNLTPYFPIEGTYADSTGTNRETTLQKRSEAKLSAESGAPSGSLSVYDENGNRADVTDTQGSSAKDSDTQKDYNKHKKNNDGPLEAAESAGEKKSAKEKEKAGGTFRKEDNNNSNAAGNESGSEKGRAGEPSRGEDKIKVKVIIENSKYPKSEGAPWDGTLLDTEAEVPESYNMMQAIDKVCEDNDIECAGSKSTYISGINGLYEFMGGKGSGWMGTLNDWFTSTGFAEVEIKEGDEIKLQYTRNLGEDIGSVYAINGDKRLKNIKTDTGELAPEFDSDFRSYNLTVPVGTKHISIYTTAINKNYLVKSKVGDTWYNRGAKIPVKDGTDITVVSGDPSWPSMNSYFEKDTSEPAKYKIHVIEGAREFYAEGSGNKCDVKLDRPSGMYKTGEKVTATLKYNKTKYEVDADSVRAYVGGSNKYIRLRKEGNDRYSFKMPGNEVEVRAACVTRKDYPLTVTSDLSACTVKLSRKNGKYVKGEKVDFALAPKAGKRINDLSVRVYMNESGEEVKLKYISTGKYSFIMPDEDACIYAQSENIETNGLRGYAISAGESKITKKMKDDSRTSIVSLPKGITVFDLSLDLIKNEKLTAVRVKDIFGETKIYTNTEITGISAGTTNVALLGEDVTVTVITEDTDSKSHTYTIRVKTSKDKSLSETPDAEIIASGKGVLPYKKTLMTSGVTVYDVDYPTEVENYKAKTANIYMRIFPTYEEAPDSISVRCKYTNFICRSIPGKDWDYEGKAFIPVPAGKTIEVPVEIDFTRSDGSKVTKKYLYRITNARYAKQKFKVLSANGNPISPAGFSINGSNISMSDVQFEGGAFSLDLAPGKYTATSMKKTCNFNVTDNLTRPIKTDTLVFETDTPEYECEINCPDNHALFTIKEVNMGFKYIVKGSDTKYRLPPGKYEVKAIDEDSHKYAKAEFTVSDRDTEVTAARPYLLDPEYVTDRLNLLEEIQVFDAGDGYLGIYIPDYQSNGIVSTPVVVKNPDSIKVVKKYKQKSFYYDSQDYCYLVKRDEKEHSIWLKYEVYNNAHKSDVYSTDVMELYMPPYKGGAAEEEVLMPADVRLLEPDFGIRDGSCISGLHSSYNAMLRPETFGSAIPVKEKIAGITNAQLTKAKYKVKYKMRFSAEKDGKMKNVWLEKFGYAAFYRISNDRECAVFETHDVYGSGYLLIDPDIANSGYPDRSVPGWYEVTVWFEDSGGNKSRENTITVYIDGQPPRAQVSLDSETGVYDSKQSEPTYANKPITLRVNAQDYETGLHDKAYSYDAGETWSSTPERTFTESAVVDIGEIWVKDKLGNITTGNLLTFDAYMYGKTSGYKYLKSEPYNKTSLVSWKNDTANKKKRYLYIDMVKPEITVFSDYDENDKELVLKVRASDDVSGLPEKAYSFDGGSTWQSGNKYSVKLGEYRGDQVQVRDKAGNIAVYNENFVWNEESVKQNVPKIKEVKVGYGKGGDVGYDGRKWYQSATLTIVPENEQDIAAYSFGWDKYSSNPSKRYTDPTLFKPGTITVINKAGFAAAYDKEIEITNIDSIPPKIDSCKFDGNVGRPVREITAKINASDSLSKGLKYAISVIPLADRIPGYKDPPLNLEWTSDLDDSQFKISNVGRKYGKASLSNAAYFFKGAPLDPDADSLVWGVRLWAKDAAGNISYEDNTMVYGGYIDKQGPEISEVTTEYKYFNDKSGIVRVYVAATEPRNGAGLAAKAYSFDGGKTWRSGNSISVPIGASIAAGQIKVRDSFGNISTYNKLVKTTLQNVIARINKLDPRKAKDKDYQEILKLYRQLSEREKKKVYNWDAFIRMLNNRKDQDWDDDFGNIGDPADPGGNPGGNDKPGSDPGENPGAGDNSNSGNNNGNVNGGASGSGGNARNDNTGRGDTASDGRKFIGITPASVNMNSVQDLSSSNGATLREAVIDKPEGSGVTAKVIKPVLFFILLFIALGAYITGAGKRYRRWKEDTSKRVK